MTPAPHTARIFCIVQNYVAHIRELGNPMPEAAVIFTWPLPCLVATRQGASIRGRGGGAYWQGRAGITERAALAHIDALTLGADLTLRELQIAAKQGGLPWDQAKAFEQSAPLGEFLAYDPASIDLDDLDFRCRINGELRQPGNTSDMLFGFRRLVAEFSSIWTLRPEDMIYIGTPSGVVPRQLG